MIQKLFIRNFRSVREAEIPLGSMNAFIGRNNAGKSNVMKALHLVLGDVYPSVRSFNDKDFHNYDKSSSIVIEVVFDSALVSNREIQGFRLTYDGAEVEYVALDADGDTLTYGASGREVRVSNDMRDEVALMYLGLDRQASQQVRATQWTLYGKLLRHIEKQIAETKKANFRQEIDAAYATHIQPELQQMEEILRTHVKRQTGLDLHLQLAVHDPIETLKNLRPYLRGESPREFDAEDMGAGTQSALAVAIARAYAEIVRQPLILAIEEPELYLHPHGCRHFRRLLEELSENGVQVICTTHERSFVDVAHFESVHLVRNESGETKVSSGIGQQRLSTKAFKLVSKFDDEINEIFFADKVVLVEGPADRIACQLALEKLGVELDRDSISVTECGGTHNIKPIAEVLKLFQIPTFVLVDEDPDNQNTAALIQDLKALLGQENILLQQPNLEGMLGLSNKLNKTEAIRNLPGLFEQADSLPIYESLKGRLFA